MYDAQVPTVPWYRRYLRYLPRERNLERYQLWYVLELWYVLGSDELGAVSAQCSYCS